jgi:hypothetical protein
MQNPEGKCLTSGKCARPYFTLKDMQSVHLFSVGRASCVLTVIQSREQKSFVFAWFAHWDTVHLMLSLMWLIFCTSFSFMSIMVSFEDDYNWQIVELEKEKW